MRTIEESQAIIKAAEDLTRQHMSSYDPSHDYLHVQRVVKTALKLAQDTKADYFIVHLAALFHDLFDSKYSSSSDRSLLHSFFDSNPVEKDTREAVMRIVENVSYSKEVKRIKAGQQSTWHETCIELHCVQDADKLDAMGAIGIMRCSAFSCASNRPLVSHVEDKLDPSCSIAHYHDKLLKLQGMLKTERGREMGQKRHNFMLSFLQQIDSEL